MPMHARMHAQHIGQATIDGAQYTELKPFVKQIEYVFVFVVVVVMIIIFALVSRQLRFIACLHTSLTSHMSDHVSIHMHVCIGHR